jgi:hypothetical protein
MPPKKTDNQPKKKKATVEDKVRVSHANLFAFYLIFRTCDG